MSQSVTWYFQHIHEILHKVEQTQQAALERGAEMMAETISAGRSLFVFGASHAGILTEEMVYRTGGLALINPLLNSNLMLNTRPITLTSRMERLPGFGREIVAASALQAGDLLLLHSVSGRNTVAIDAALAAKERGVKIIVLTNLTYSQQVTSRHSSGQRLYELGDIVLDNCGDFEDSSTAIDGLAQKVGATSTAIGAVIVNSLVIRTVEKLLERGVVPPVFHSANVDGGDEFNRRILEEYRERIHYM